uniref:Uncharacterized protein MANES_01G080800 n=1 Tax=Rhizophora mucronata TaxID=61149 RepID=A0A2P2LT60_RHIMU
MAAASLAPAVPLRFNPYSTLRFKSLFTSSKPILFKTLIKRSHSSREKSLLCRQLPFHYGSRRFFVSSASGASPSSMKPPELAENRMGEMGNRVGGFRKKSKIADIKTGPLEGLDRFGRIVVVMGWVRTLRVQRSITFIEVNDGSCLSNMQCVMDAEAEGYDQIEGGMVTTGASILVQGIVVESQGSKQKVELKVNKIVVVGESDPSYPIQKKKVGREFLRTKAHLRPRTNTFGAVARVRNALAYSTHKFFQENGFVWVSSPIITASDCEGAGEQFCVTTLIPSSEEAAASPMAGIPKTQNGLIDWSQVG